MVSVQLQQDHFDTFARWIKRVDAIRVQEMFQKLYGTMVRLGVKGGRVAGVVGIPNGSDQIAVGSMNTWLDKVTIEDKEAVVQVEVLYATALARMKG